MLPGKKVRDIILNKGYSAKEAVEFALENAIEGVTEAVATTGKGACMDAYTR